YIGSRDDALTARGQRQAEQLAAALALLPVAAVYTSPLRRTRETAQPLANKLGLPVMVADALREQAFGDWEGMTRAEVLSASVASADLLRVWETDAMIAPPGGESVAAMTERVSSFVTTLCEHYPAQTVVLVSHVGPIKVLITATLQVAPGTARQMFLDPATISVVDWSNMERILRLFNSHAHLGWTAARWMQQ
ncbi:MAG: hypothetical protein CYG59_18065, partial [Chloroflexi bacterium]